MSSEALCPTLQGGQPSAGVQTLLCTSFAMSSRSWPQWPAPGQILHHTFCGWPATGSHCLCPCTAGVGYWASPEDGATGISAVIIHFINNACLYHGCLQHIVVNIMLFYNVVFWSTLCVLTADILYMIKCVHKHIYSEREIVKEPTHTPFYKNIHTHTYIFSLKNPMSLYLYVPLNPKSLLPPYISTKPWIPKKTLPITSTCTWTLKISYYLYLYTPLTAKNPSSLYFYLAIKCKRHILLPLPAPNP